MKCSFALASGVVCLLITQQIRAQDPTGALEGIITDTTGGAISHATLTVTNIQTGYARADTASNDGLFRFALLPIGQYRLEVKAPQFANYTQCPISIIVSQTARVGVQLQLASVTQSVNVSEDANPVDTASNTLGKTVNGREILELPLNGRNFTQLGLLQTGVAPLSSGVMTQGGSMRAGQAYAVNGQRLSPTTICWTERKTSIVWMPATH